MTAPVLSPKLPALRRDHPEWTVEYGRDVHAWIAVSHPAQNSTHILAADDLDELRAKIEHAEGA